MNALYKNDQMQFRKHVRVIEILSDRIVVQCNATGEIETLMGMGRPKLKLNVGDEGSIVYRNMVSIAFWVWETENV